MYIRTAQRAVVVFPQPDSPTRPYISSSPDGIIENDHIVEIKCPFTAKDKDISPTTVPYLKLNEDGQFYLEESHDYYFQIQGQLLCTGAKKCTLVVCAAASLKVKDIKFLISIEMINSSQK